MIRSWKDAVTRRVYDGENPRRLSGLDADRARSRLATLNAARSLADLGRLNSIGLHKLKGKRRMQWAVTINGPWRVCFRFADGDAYDVEIVDYHKG